ncbi:hypothetical protein HDU92_004609, partial [Lobulomyces angularis]
MKNPFRNNKKSISLNSSTLNSQNINKSKNSSLKLINQLSYPLYIETKVIALHWRSLFNDFTTSDANFLHSLSSKY